MQISANTLLLLNQLRNNPNLPNYAVGYNAVLQDLKTQNPNPSPADQQILNWISIAYDVNSGASTFDAVAIRAVNQAAVLDQLGEIINLFGPQEQNSSNSIAKAFFTDIINGNGVIPDFQQIQSVDAQKGVTALGVAQYSWAGAAPGIATGFSDTSFYDQLTPAEQGLADAYHLIALSTTQDYFSALLLRGYTQNQADAFATDSVSITYTHVLGLQEDSLAGAFHTALTAAQNNLQELDQYIQQEGITLQQFLLGPTNPQQIDFKDYLAQPSSASIYNLAPGVSLDLAADGSNAASAILNVQDFLNPSSNYIEQTNASGGTLSANKEVVGFGKNDEPVVTPLTGGGVSAAFTNPTSDTTSVLSIPSASSEMTFLSGGNYFVIPDGASPVISNSGPDITLSDFSTAGSTPQILIDPTSNNAWLVLTGGQGLVNVPLNASSPNSTFNITNSSDGTTVAINNAAGQNVGGVQVSSSGNSYATYNTNADGTNSIKVVNTNNGILTQQTTTTADGTSVSYYDPITGAFLIKLDFSNSDGLQLPSLGSSLDGNPAESTILGGYIANAVAGIIVSDFAFAHNIPASVVSQAFIKAGIDAAEQAITPTANPPDFATDVAASISNMASGILGSIAGADLAKLTGFIPTQLGSLVGAAAFQATAQQLSAYIVTSQLADTALAQSTLEQFGITNVSSANALPDATTFGDTFGTSFETAGLDIAVSMVINEIIPSNNTAAEVGGSLGAAIGSYWGPIASAVGEAIGTLAGDALNAFENFIGGGSVPTVGPNAVAQVGINAENVSIEFKETFDNGGNVGGPNSDLQTAINMGNDFTTMFNDIIKSTGGTVIGWGPSSVYSFGVFKDKLFFAPGDIAPGYAPPQDAGFTNATDCIDAAVMNWLQNITIIGGNPIVMYAFNQSLDGSLANLITNVDAASIYSQYVADPLGYLAAVTTSSDPNALSTFMNALSQAQAIGLDQVTMTGPHNLSISESLANMISGIPTDQKLAAEGVSLAVSLTDPGTPTVVFTSAQMTEYAKFVQGEVVSPLEIMLKDSENTATVSNVDFEIAPGVVNETINGANDKISIGYGSSVIVWATGLSHNTITGNSDILMLAGNGDTATLDYSTINCPAGSLNQMIYGNNDLFLVGTGIGASLVGNYNTVGSNGDPGGGVGANILIDGSYTTVDLSNCALNFVRGSAFDTVYGGSDLILTGPGVNLAAYGTGFTIGVNGDPSGGGGTTIVASGPNITTSESNATIAYNAGSKNAWINGGGNYITFGANVSSTVVGPNNLITGGNGDYPMVAGKGNIVNLSNSTINFVAGDANNILVGSNNLVLVGTGVNLTIIGNNNTIGRNGDPGGGTGVQLSIMGTGNNIELPNPSVTYSSDLLVSTSPGAVITATAPGQTLIADASSTTMYGYVGGNTTFQFNSALSPITINNYTPTSDVIDITNFAPTTATVTASLVAGNQTLFSLSNTVGQSTSFYINGNFTAGSYVLSSDGVSGTYMVDPPKPAAVAQAVTEQTTLAPNEVSVKLVSSGVNNPTLSFNKVAAAVTVNTVAGTATYVEAGKTYIDQIRGFKTFIDAPKQTLIAANAGTTLNGSSGDTLIGSTIGSTTFQVTSDVANLIIENLAKPGSLIDIKNFPLFSTAFNFKENAADTAGTITLHNSSAGTDTIIVPGSYPGSFGLSSDGHSGTEVVYHALTPG